MHGSRRTNSLVGAAAVKRNVSERVWTATASEQSTGHSGLTSKAEEEGFKVSTFGKASIFTAELVTLNRARDIIWSSKHKNIAVFSLSSMVTIHSRHLETGYVQKFTITSW